MDTPTSTPAQPRSMRVVAWLVVAVGAWGVIRFVGGGRPLDVAIIWNIVLIISGVGLLRGKRWAYVALCLIFLEAFVQGVWFFFVREAEYSLATRLVVGVPVVLFVVVPLGVLLRSRSRSWFLASRG